MKVLKYLLFILLLISIALNVWLLYELKIAQKTILEAEAESFRFVRPLKHPLIDSNIQTKKNILHFNNLDEKLNEEIAKFTSDSSNVGVFVQDLNTGAWLGLNEREFFYPASLLKIPIAMAILKKVDRGEIKLTEKVETRFEDLDDDSGILYKKGIGYKLSILDALKIMILNSDNTAKNILKRQLLDEELNSVFAHVGISNPYLSETEDSISPRGYSRIFKSLYFSTYLTPELSELLLDIASDTQVENLISAGVPPEIQVSHKFGATPNEIADCGIVYVTGDDYLLCIIVKDVESKDAIKLVGNLSKIIYKFVSL